MSHHLPSLIIHYKREGCPLHYPFENTPLPFAYDALEPYIDEETMRIHHQKHLQTYIDNLNRILAQRPGLQKLPLEELVTVSGRLPHAASLPLARNAGGVYNHRFFFEGLTPHPMGKPDGDLACAIDKTFGSWEAFQKSFTNSALAVFGSGYTWLAMDRRGRLVIVSTANQEAPLARGLRPLLCLDVWEHAYYLKHQNRRGDYLPDWFAVVDWDVAGARYIRWKSAKGR